MATENAVADATALANAAGVKLIRVLSLSLDHWSHPPVPLMLAKRADTMSLTDEAGQDVLEPGKTQIHATVNAIFEIGPQ